MNQSFRRALEVAILWANEGKPDTVRSTQNVANGRTNARGLADDSKFPVIAPLLDTLVHVFDAKEKLEENEVSGL